MKSGQPANEEPEPLPPLGDLLRRLGGHLHARRRLQLAMLTVLMLIAAVAEAMSLGAGVPFLAVLTTPESLFGNPRAQAFIRLAGISSPAELLVPVTLIFASLALLSGAVRLLVLWANTRISMSLGADLTREAYRRVLHQPYANHAAQSTNKIIATLRNKVGQIVGGTIFPIMNIGSSTFVLVSIVTLLLAINPTMTLGTVAGLGTIYFLIMRFTKEHILRNGERIATATPAAMKALREGLGGIRDILIDATQQTYCDLYQAADEEVRLAQASSTFLSAVPRIALETLGIVLIAGLAYGQGRRPGGLGAGIAALGALALGAQRLLPIMQSIFANWSTLHSSRASLRDSLEVLDLALPAWLGEPAPAPMPFARGIRLRGVSFRYRPDSEWVLRDLDLTIEKGSRVGIIGETGSGKSTLLDIMMGLLPPTEGTLEIDGQVVDVDRPRGWQMHIAHVPQAIYLSDASIAENIAFGIPAERIDRERVERAGRQARLADTVERWPLRWDSLVGERGVRLSGGQRQRIGIARALYKQADVVVLDEATSALDGATERSVMDAIADLPGDLTVLVVAHRLTTLRGCDRVVEIAGGRVIRTGSFEEIVGSAA